MSHFAHIQAHRPNPPPALVPPKSANDETMNRDDPPTEAPERRQLVELSPDTPHTTAQTGNPVTNTVPAARITAY